MKIAVIGASGQLGTELCKIIPDKNLIPLNQPDIEITNLASVKDVLFRYKPDVIINTAAFVRVDDCETEVDKAYSVNALGARNIAVIAQSIDAKLIHLSTDYVFGGEKNRKSPYTEFDKPDPISIYGKSKLAGEEYVKHCCFRSFIVRTSGLFGRAGSEGKGGNFIETILKLAKEKKELHIVNDQVFSPTYAVNLAKRILELSNTEYYGTFHLTNSGICSWYEFAAEIVRLAGIKTPVIPITSNEFPQKAARPAYSVLENYQWRLLGHRETDSWTNALNDYLMNR